MWNRLGKTLEKMVRLVEPDSTSKYAPKLHDNYSCFSIFEKTRSMKTLYFIIILVFFGFISNISAQVSDPSWQWVKGSTGGAVIEVAHVTADKNGNTIVLGYLEGDSVTFGPYTIHSTSQYTTNFLVKYSPSGQVLWTFTMPGFANYNFNNLATDTNGNIFTFVSPINTPIVYFMKVSSSGSLLWVDSNAAPYLRHTNGAAGVTTDQSGNAYFSGGFTDSMIVFGHDTLRSLVPSTGLYASYFLVKYSAVGTEQWARTIKPTTISSGGGAVATDMDNNLFVSGGFGGDSVTIGNITLHSPYSRENSFVAKYDTAGTVLWARSLNSLNTSVSAICTDHSGYVYVYGRFLDSLFIDDSLVIKRPSSNTNFYVLKFNTAGSLLWSTASYETNTGNSLISPYSMTLDLYGHIYLSGGIFDSISWLNDSIVYKPARSGSSDASFVLSLDTAGHVICAQTFPQGGDDVNGLASDPSGDLYWAGDYFDSVFVIGSDTLRGGAIESGFLAKFSPCGKVKTGLTSITPTPTLALHPNPSNGFATVSFTIPDGVPNASLHITDILGKEIKSYALQSSQTSIQIDAAGLTAGIYLVSLMVEGHSVVTQKMAVE